MCPALGLLGKNRPDRIVRHQQADSPIYRMFLCEKSNLADSSVNNWRTVQFE
jgi:hypothetical protein